MNSYLATRTLNQIATGEELNYPEAVKRDFYIDDLLNGTYTVSNQDATTKIVRAAINQGGIPPYVPTQMKQILH